MFDEPVAAFGRFRVTEAIGDGRFGPVYLGVDPETDQVVVIRTFAEMMTVEQHSRLLVALQRLCESPLDHASIATPIAAGAENGVPFLAHSYLPGTSVDEYLRTHGPRPLADVVVRVTHLAAAIDFAAAAGVHHGTLSPRDILFASHSTGLSGFGLVQALRDAGLELSEPTQADDVYALAAMTFELLVGYRYTGGSVTDALAPLRGVAGIDHDALVRALEPALSPAPERWPATALAFAASLREAVAETPADAPVTRERAAHPRTTADVGRLSFGGDDAMPDTPMVPTDATVHTADVMRDAGAGAAPVFDAPLQALGLTLDASSPAHRMTGQDAADDAPANHRLGPVAPDDAPPDLTIVSTRAVGPATEDTVTSAADTRSRVAEPAPRPAAAGQAPSRSRTFDAPLGTTTPPKPPVLSREPDPFLVSPLADPRWKVIAAAAVVAILVIGTFAWLMLGGGADTPATSVATGSGSTTNVDEPQLDVLDPTAPVDPTAPESRDAASSPMTEPAPVPTESVPPPVDARPSQGAAPNPPAAAERPGARAQADTAAERRREPPLPPAAPTRAPVVAERPAAAPAARGAGRMLVRSTPAGARVTVDGIDRGQTPVAVRELSLGLHTVVVTAAGYAPWQQTVRLTADRPSMSFEVLLDASADAAQAPRSPAAPSRPAADARAAGLQVDSRPSGAQVWVDGVQMGVTPLYLPGMSAGAHTVRIEMPGYRPWTTSVSVGAGEPARVAASLER